MKISRIRNGGLCTAVVIVLLMSAVHRANSSVVDGTPTGRWPTATPASVGLDQKRLATLGADLAKGKYSLVDSFQVFRCDKVVYERQYSHDYSKIYHKQAGVRGPLNAHLTGPYNYFDPAFHPYYQGTDLHTMQSISKTVTATVIGIALARGDFKSGLDTPVLTWFDAASVKNVDERKRRMTLKHVLTMTTGLDWNENTAYDDWRNDASGMEATEDWVKYTIDKPMAQDPGTHFAYSSGATELLAYIFQKETGQDIEDYAEQQLFQPLGMKHHWKRSPSGLIDTEGGLFLNGADLAKVGYLYLHDGVWGGQRLLTHQWVEQATTPFVDTGWQGLKYGFKWWLYPRKDGVHFVWMGIGFGGQRLMVFPEEQLIAVFTAWDILKDPSFDAKLAERLLPAVLVKSCPAGEPQ
jgi:CubicO group peptidase (beta-lactamase class C family)